MTYFDQEILNGLEAVPTPNSPGSIIVIGDAQSVLTGHRPGETVLAATKYGNGKIFVAAHDVYLKWLDEKDDQMKLKFMNNVKFWLTGDQNVSTKDIGKLKDILNKSEPFENYKIIRWHHSYKVNSEAQNKLLEYVFNGGSLFCAATCWGHLQLNPSDTLNDIDLYKFLKDYTGILLTSDCLSLPNEMRLRDNKAKYSHLDIAMKNVCDNPDKIDKYGNTLNAGLEVLVEEGILSGQKLKDLKEMIINKCQQDGLRAIPTEKTPLKDSKNQDICKLLGKCFILGDSEKAPSVEKFPGDFSNELEMLSDVNIILETNFEERLSTGYYLPAGISIILNVLEGNTKGWSIRIGAHTDKLYHCDRISRWPEITVWKPLSKNMCFSSPFGGLVYFESSKAGSITVNMSNVVESPFIDLRQPETLSDWSRRKNSPGLWAELAGQNIIFTTPSYCVRHIEDPMDVIQFWDRIVATHHQCRGTRPEDYRRERVVNDVQPSAGYMHSGYPIVTHLDCCQQDCDECIFDLKKLYERGNWGLFHEIGHNMQRDEWTFDGCTEVTVNIFSMHAMDKVIGHAVTKQKWLLDQKKSYVKFFAKQPSYNDWKHDCGSALFTFAQLVKHFGWESMYEFMKNYEEDIRNGHHSLPKNNQDKIDQWVIRYSKIVGKNIKPQFEMFGLPVSSQVNKHVEHLPIWCPAEEKNPIKFFAVS